MITPFERRPKDGSASATRKTATAASANHACNPEGVVLPWLRTMPLPNEGMSIGIRPNEIMTTSTGHIGAEAADRPFSENGNGRSCPVPEELSDHSNGLACEADERHLPRAAQLTLVLKATEDLARLPPVSQLESRAILPVSVVAKIDRFATGVYGPEPQELAIPVRARGSKKVQLGTFLVATVFTALALYIWTIGSNTSPDSTYEPQVASSAANLSAPFPSSSSGQASMLTPPQAIEKSSGQSAQLSQLVTEQPQASSEPESAFIAESSSNFVHSGVTGTSSARGREQKTVSKDSQTAAFSQSAVISRSIESVQPGEPPGDQVLLATPQASAAPAQIPSSKGASRRLGPEEIKLFVTRGEQLLATGDIVAARIVLQRAAESDDAAAALALGAAYDPNVLARLGVVGISADLEKARTWYHKAESLGSADARRRLGLLER
jgi:hypothetical protein